MAIKSVKLIANTGNVELEGVLPADRVVEVDDSGALYLADKQFRVTEEMIEEVVYAGE